MISFGKRSNTKKFIKYSKNNRDDFLQVVSELMLQNMDYIINNQILEFNSVIGEQYSNYLYYLFINYQLKNKVNPIFSKLTKDFISSIQEQCSLNNFNSTADEIKNLLFIIYNMLVNVHRFSYELYTLNKKLDEKSLFYGDDLEALLNEKKITLEEFREISFYDTDNITYCTLENDLKYLKKIKMLDIYFIENLAYNFNSSDYEYIFNQFDDLNKLGLISEFFNAFIKTLKNLLIDKRPLIIK